MFVSCFLGALVDFFLTSSSRDMTATVLRNAALEKKTANYLPAEQDFTLGVHICDQCKASAAFSREPGS